MLILTRKPGESLYIGDNIKITIVEIKGHQIRVGIDAPTDLRIYREEIYLQILEENKAAAAAAGPGSDAGLEGLSANWSGATGEGDPNKKKKASLGSLSVGSLKAHTPKKVDGPDVIVKRKKGTGKEDE